jgi:CheY-like chemotaxis protein
LAAICSLAQTAQGELNEMPVADCVATIATEARRASELVTRLVGFAGESRAQPQQVELNGLLRNLSEFREREWKVRGIQVRTLLAEVPLTVMGSLGQLEQVFLNLLVHAEQSLAESSDKLITIRTSLIARRALVEISFSGPPTEGDPFSNGPEQSDSKAGLSVCRSLITGHGGEFRLVQPAAGNPAFQVELPCTSRESAVTAVPENGRPRSYPLTALIIEPSEAVQTELRSMLASRGFRVVPVRSSDEGLDLAQRLRFDAVFCSSHAPGLNWVETAEQLKPRVSLFALLSDSYNAELVADFEGEGCFVLAKPLDEVQLDRILAAVHDEPGDRGNPER